VHYTLCDLFSDLTQNAIEAGSTEVTVTLTESDRSISLSVADDGKGMTEGQLKRATDPFYTDGVKHPGRKIGLGIPFLIQTAAQTGGGWEIRSRKGAGTTVEARFDLTNLDVPPVGDVPGLIRTVLLFEGPAETLVRRTFEGGRGRTSYEIRKTELADALGGLEDAGALVLLGEYLRSLEETDEENEA
jgi:hypothetical protein